MTRANQSGSYPGKHYISTGHLPPDSEVQALVDAAYERLRTNDEGQHTQHDPT